MRLRKEKRKSVEKYDRGSIRGMPLVGLKDYDDPESEIIETNDLKVSFLEGEKSLIERVNSIRSAKKNYSYSSSQLEGGLVEKSKFSKYMKIYEWQGKWNKSDNHPNFEKIGN